MKLLVNLYMHILLLVLTTVILFCMVCLTLHSEFLSDFQRIQNTAAWILTKCGDRNYPSINLLKKLHCSQRITYTILILTFKAYHKTAPQYICDLIIPRTYIIGQLDQIIPLH